MSLSPIWAFPDGIPELEYHPSDPAEHIFSGNSVLYDRGYPVQTMVATIRNPKTGDKLSYGGSSNVIATKDGIRIASTDPVADVKLIRFETDGDSGMRYIDVHVERDETVLAVAAGPGAKANDSYLDGVVHNGRVYSVGHNLDDAKPIHTVSLISGTADIASVRGQETTGVRLTSVDVQDSEAFALGDNYCIFFNNSANGTLVNETTFPGVRRNLVAAIDDGKYLCIGDDSGSALVTTSEPSPGSVTATAEDATFGGFSARGDPLLVARVSSSKVVVTAKNGVSDRMMNFDGSLSVAFEYDTGIANTVEMFLVAGSSATNVWATDTNKNFYRSTTNAPKWVKIENAVDLTGWSSEKLVVTDDRAYFIAHTATENKMLKFDGARMVEMELDEAFAYNKIVTYWGSYDEGLWVGGHDKTGDYGYTSALKILEPSDKVSAVQTVKVDVVGSGGIPIGGIIGIVFGIVVVLAIAGAAVYFTHKKNMQAPSFDPHTAPPLTQIPTSAHY